MIRKFTIVFILVFAFIELADAQNFYSKRRDRNWTFSYGIGFSTYHGDLHDAFYDGFGSALGPSLGMGLRRRFGTQFSIRADLNWYQIGGSDQDVKGGFLSTRLSNRTDVGAEDDRDIRNLNFRSRNLELSVVGQFNFLEIDRGYRVRPRINPYLTLGLALSTNRPKTFLPGEEGNYTVRLWQIQTEEAAPVDSYPKSIVVIPFGLGISFRANQYIDIIIEGARRFTFTDYLDDVATVYPSRQQITDWNGGQGSPQADIALQVFDRSVEGGFNQRPPGAIRGRENNDAYYVFQIRLEMYLPDNFMKEIFGGSRRKPKFR